MKKNQNMKKKKKITNQRNSNFEFIEDKTKLMNTNNE